MNWFKKAALCILLVFVMTLCGNFTVPSNGALEMSYEPSEYYKKSIYYERLMAVELTGNYRTDIVRVARSQTEYHEGGKLADLDGHNTSSKGNYTEYGYFYKYQAAWCGMFVSWCARQAGIPTSVIKTTGAANADAFGVKYHSRSKYTPQIGDIIIFDWSPRNNSSPASKYGDHVGIVYDVDDTYVYTVSGNLSNKVREKAYKLTDTDIKGYGVYTDIPALESVKYEPGFSALIDRVSETSRSTLPPLTQYEYGSVFAEHVTVDMITEELPSYSGYTDELFHVGIKLTDTLSGRELNDLASLDYEVTVNIHGPYQTSAPVTEPTAAPETTPAPVITEDEIPEYLAPGPKPGDENKDKPGPGDKPVPEEPPKPGDPKKPGENDSEPAATPVTEPTTEPVTVPATEPTTEPVTVPATEPTTEPVTLPATEPITEPVTVPVTEPTTEPVTVPATEPTTEPVTVPATEPTTEPVTVPVTEPITEPVTEPVTEPITLPETEPSLEHFTEKSKDTIDYLVRFTMPGIYRIDITVTGDIKFSQTLEIVIEARNYGDINLDGDIDAEDLTVLARAVAKISELSHEAMVHADVNRDGQIDADDLTYLARIIAKIG